MRTRASLWQRANDPETYGEQAGWFCLVTPDGENDLPGGPWATEEEAYDYAAEQGWRVVPLDLEAQPISRPGDMAASYSAETGMSYEAALVACNMD